MTLNESIKRLNDLKSEMLVYGYLDKAHFIQQGIEAFVELKQLRIMYPGAAERLLPGENKE